MSSRLTILPACAAAVMAACATFAPAASAAELTRGHVAVADTTKRTCHTKLAAAGAAGLVHRRVTASASGLVRARLAAAGDWDLGVFDAATGRSVAGSAHFGGTELAEGVVRVGQALVVQACRRAGAGSSALLTVHVSPLDPPTPEKIRLARIQTPTDFTEDAVSALGFDETEHGRPGFRDVLLHGTKDLQRLQASGLDYRIIVDDLVAADRRQAQATTATEPAPMPSGRVTYRRLPDYSADMKRLVAENPQWVRPIVLNHKSLEGRPIEGIEISNNVNAPDGKPVFLQMGVHHAREWPSSEHAIEWAFEMVNGLNNKDERVTKLMDRVRLIVVPLVNPDGFNLSRESVVDAAQPAVDPGFAYKRKNCRIVDFALPAEGECGDQANRLLGTDPNRNYGGNWGGGGASDSKISDTYRGADPFSEPETQAVRQLIASRQVVALITNHTYSDLVLRPPGLQGTPPTPDDAAYKELGAAMTAENGYQNLYSYELYDTTGTTEDWSYFATGGFGFTFEIGAAYQDANLVGVGFHPPYPYVILEFSQNKYGPGGGNKEAYYKISEWAAEAKNHSVLTGRAPAGSVIRLHKEFTTQTSEIVGEHPRAGTVMSFDDVIDTTMVVPPSGTFEYHVNPSSRPLRGVEAYSLTCESSSGRVLGRQQVVVNRGETKDLGVLCAGEGLGRGAGERLVLQVRPRTASLRKLARSGLPARVTCSSTCTVNAKLTVDKRTARKLKVPRTLATGKASRVSGTRTVKLRFKRTARGRVARAKALTATLRVTARSGDARAVSTRRLKLKR